MSAPAHQSQDKLLEFAYGELPAPEAEAVEAHVKGCARCAESLDGIRSVRSTMAKLSAERAPDAGLESLLAYAEQAARRNAEVARPKPWWSRFIVPLASVTALAVVGVVFVKTKDDYAPDPLAAAVDAKHDAMKKEAAQQKAKERAESEVERKAADVGQQQAVAATPTAAPAAQPPPPPDEKAGKYASGEAPRDLPPSKADFPRAGPTKPAPTTMPALKGSGRGGEVEQSKANFDTQAPLAGALGNTDLDRAAAADKLAAPAPKEAKAEEEAPRPDYASLSKVKSKKAAAPPPSKNEALREDWSNAGRGKTLQLNDGAGAGVKQALEGNANKGMLSGSFGTPSGSGAGGLGTLGTGPQSSAPLGLSTGSGSSTASVGTPGTAAHAGGDSVGGGGSSYAQQGYGLNTRGTAPKAAPSPPVQPTPAPRPEAQAEPKPMPKVQAAPKPVEPAPVTTVLAPPSAAAPAPSVAAAEPARRSSIGMSLGSTGGAKKAASSADLEDDNAVAQEKVIDQYKATKDAEVDTRRRQATVRAELDKARQTIGAGSRETGVQIAVRVLQRLNPTGGNRLEALTLVCETYESMGDSERAGPFCDAIVREFSSSAEARQILERGRVNDARAKAQRQYDESLAPAERPAPAKPSATKKATSVESAY